LTEIARACWHLFGLRGYARVDFRVDQDGQPWVLEVNANPCISPDGGFVAAAAQVGLSLNDVVGRIIQDSVPLASRRQGD
jgi:D-alanine-D-alanine ligase